MGKLVKDMDERVITLRCLSCSAVADYPTDIDPNLPDNVWEIHSTCPICSAGDFGSEVWYDKDMNEVSQDIY